MAKLIPSEQFVQQTPVDFDVGKFPSMSTIVWLKSYLVRRLPLELVELVLDDAEYWPHTTVTKPRIGLVRTPVKWRGTSSSIISPSWPSRESEAMQEVLGFTLYSPPLASESTFTRATTSKNPLRRLVRRDPEVLLPPRGQYPVRMIVFEAVSRRDDVQTGKFCDVGIVREDDQLPEQGTLPAVGERRASGVFSAFRNSKQSKPDKTHHLVTQRECWFSPVAKAEGKYVIKWRYDEDSDDGIKKENDEMILPTTPDFIKKVTSGDSIGLWAPVVRGNCVHSIDEVRLHVFWAV